MCTWFAHETLQLVLKFIVQTFQLLLTPSAKQVTERSQLIQFFN